MRYANNIVFLLWAWWDSNNINFPLEILFLFYSSLLYLPHMHVILIVFKSFHHLAHRHLASRLGRVHHTRSIPILERMSGVEPPSSDWKSDIIAIILHPLDRSGVFIPLKHDLRTYERMTGFEPATCCLEDNRSTPFG